MRLYLRSRRSLWVAAAMAGVGAVVGLIGEVGVPVPNLAAGPAYGAVLALLAPAPAVAVLAQALAGRDLPAELAAARPVPVLDLIWVILGVACFAVTASALDAAGMAGAGIRNLAGFTGLMLVADRYLPQGLAAAAPTAYALIGSTLGQARDPAWWVWFLRPEADPTSLTVAALAALGGATALVRGASRRPETAAA